MNEEVNKYSKGTFELQTIICIPVYNDWTSIENLLVNIEEIAQELGTQVNVLLVDDGSDEKADEILLRSACLSICKLEILKLRRNVGHQRAIALGLCYINDTYKDSVVVVMDGDGEDAPKDIIKLLLKCQKLEYSKIVFAQRRKRTEGWIFRLGYKVYRNLHYLLTGRRIAIGNFSVIPPALLSMVVGVSEIWNHYASGILHARLPMDTVPLDKSRRLAGRSKMNFTSLIIHGLSAISVYGDVVGVRLLCASGCSIIFVMAGIAIVLILRILTNLAIPGWASTAFGLLIIVLLNLVMLSGMFVLFTLNSRNSVGFLPVRDWRHYIVSRKVVYER